jgi:hypothetical protein
MNLRQFDADATVCIVYRTAQRELAANSTEEEVSGIPTKKEPTKQKNKRTNAPKVTEEELNDILVSD